MAALAGAVAVFIAVSPAFELRVAGTCFSVSAPTNAMTAAWLVALAAAVVRWRPRLRVVRRETLNRAHVNSLSLALPLFALLLAPLVGPAWTLWPAGDYVTQLSSLKSSPWGVDLATLILGQTVHRRPLVGGFLARLPPRVWSWYEQNEPYRSLLALSSSTEATVSLPSCEAVMAGLQAASVSHVVFYPNDASETLKDMVATRLPLPRIAADDRRVLFLVDVTRPGPCPP
jgi:hypothetical protein